MADARKPDLTSSEIRSRNMAAVKGKNTKPELAVRRALHVAGFRFRLHRRDLPGHPDIVLPKYRIAVRVNGCFWHGHNCRKGQNLPKTNADFWKTKIEANARRDLIARARLEEANWQVYDVWDCSIDNGIAELLAALDQRRLSSM
ncbi:DNA mismatch endonuclease Vsr [soil metagenome]